MMKRSRLMVLLIALLVFAFVSVDSVQAQSVQYGKLTGKVYLDTSGEAVAGVTVEILSDSLVSGKRATVSSASGTYVFLNLPTGKYKVRASLEGFKTVLQKNISISAGSVATVHLLLESGKIEEQVVVNATPPMVDVKTSTIDTKLSSEMLKKLPTSRDAFYDLSLTTPGMFDSGKEASWLPSPTAYGGATNENVFLVNGVNTTNPRGASWGSLVKVNYNAVEEVRVISLGSKAEYGSFSGAAIDVLTKSGSNKIHGSLGFYIMPFKPASNQPSKDFGKDWLWVGNTPAGNVEELSTLADRDMEINATLGGPLIKDKLWFYAGFANVVTDNKEPIFAPLKGWRSRLYDVKLTGELSTRLRGWMAYHHENNQNLNESWSLTWDPSMVYEVSKINHTLSAQLQWNFSDVSVATVKYLGFWTDDQPDIPSDVPDHPGYINWWKWAEVGVNGNFPYVEAQKSNRQTVQVDVSHYAENFLGEHDMKFGVQYTRGRGNWQGGYFQGYANFAYPYRWTQNINYMESWYGDTGFVMYNEQKHLNPFLTVRTTDSLGIFFDDQWSISDRLTVNLGLRFDRMTAKYGEGKVYENPASPGAINDPPPVLRTRESTGNVFDFKTFSPRIGLTYSLDKEGKTVLRANYGRYYMPLSVENLRRFGPDMPTQRSHFMFYNIPWDQVDLNGNRTVDYDEVIHATRLIHDMTPYNEYWTESDVSWRLNVADGVKDQHTDQLTVSIERELFKDFTVEASYIYKNTGNLLVNWPINRITQEEFEYERVPYVTEGGRTVQLYNLVLKDFNGDGSIDGQDVQWIDSNTDYQVVNMPDVDGKKARRVYQGLQLVLRKRYSKRWQMLASILFSNSDGSAPRSSRQDIFVDGPMILDDLWVSGLNQLVNNMEGPMPFTPKFEFKFSGSYRIPVVEADLGVRFRYHSGRPIWQMEEIPHRTPWGNDDAIVSTGGHWLISGDPKKPDFLPGPKTLDLSLSKDFKIGAYGNLTLVVDVLNVFNDSTVNAAGYSNQWGRIMGFMPPRKMRLSILYNF